LRHNDEVHRAAQPATRDMATESGSGATRVRLRLTPAHLPVVSARPILPPSTGKAKPFHLPS